MNKEKNIVLLAVAIYICLFATIVVFKHYDFQTYIWDLGVFEQTMWNTVHGRIMVNSIEEIPNHFGVHFSPWLFFLIPGYFLFQTPYFLLTVQTIFLGLGAWPLYLLARRILGNTKLSLIIAIGYLLYPSLHWINIYDFHPIAFLIPLFLFAVYFWETGKWGWSILFLLLAASTQEDAILVVLFWGVYVFLRSFSARAVGQKGLTWWTKERRVAALVIIFSLALFLISIKIIMPAFGGGLLRLDRYSNLGNGPLEITKNIIIKPGNFFNSLFIWQKLIYVIKIFLPVAFLPFFSGYAFILLIPGLLENLLTNYIHQFSGHYQYDSVLVAGIFIATIFGLKNLLERRKLNQNLLKYSLLTAVIIGCFCFAPANSLTLPFELQKYNSHWNALRQIIDLVPPEVSVATHRNLIPHLAHREKIYLIGNEPLMADVVMVDSADPADFISVDAFNDYVNKYMDSGLYDAKIFKDRYIMLTKKDILIR